MNTDGQLIDIKGVGPELAKAFANLGVHTLLQLVEYYPRRYDDYSQITKIASIQPGLVTIKAIIKQAKGRYVRRGIHITEAVASDESGSVRLVWFNQPYRAVGLKKGSEYFITGKFELNYQHLSIMNPSAELVSSFPINTARIVPRYKETKGLNSHQIRRILRNVAPVIHELPETLPAKVIKQQGLISRAEAIFAIHFPDSSVELAKAQERLGFEEVFELSLAGQLNKRDIQQEHALCIAFQQKLAVEFVANLPFKLTDAQRKVVWQIYQDLVKQRPMNRLVEGDVGSGKTVVAAMAALMVISQGYQVVFMAPTQILASQHAKTIESLLKPLNLQHNVGLLSGNLTEAQNNKTRQAIIDGKVQFIIGTHSLLQEKVVLSKLALIIIDEQHRFGVDQRNVLMAKTGHMPHVLSLTATPIPRTLALTLYGELDISILDTKPTNRKPVITQIISPNSRGQVYQVINEQLNKGRQVFVVCPIIVESYTLDVRSVEAVYEQLKKHDFKDRRVGLLHGKMKAAEKNLVMEDFLARKYDILVATTVIEVGVDVPNATVMLIESAERFGLSQLHQLRGRVGRSRHQGYCFLVTTLSSTPIHRLKALENSQDGFELAELDLKLRGPGAIYGRVQHGQLDLRIAKLDDLVLIKAASVAAHAFLADTNDLLQYTELSDKVSALRAVTNLN
jgi:ATP-dependent DNA helicase RecG